MIGAYIPYQTGFDLPFYLAKDLETDDTQLRLSVTKGGVEVQPGGTGWLFPVEITPGDNGVHASARIDTPSVFNTPKSILSVDTSSRDSLKVPQRKLHREDTETLITSHTPHALFEDSIAVKDSLRALFDNDEWLDRTETKVLGIFDDRANIDTCYVDALVSLMAHMDDPAPEYDATNLTAVNEIMDFTRLLSMYHTDLTGHMVKDYLDISYDGETKGANMGDELVMSDLLFVNEDGLLVAVMRNGKSYTLETPSQIIVWDQHTHESHPANFMNAEALSEYDGEKVDFGNGYSTENTRVFTIGDYTQSWGWGLLLPERYYSKGGDGSITATYYKFFILNPKLAERRFGNFAEEDTMDADFLNPEKWDADWEVSYKILLKLMQEASGGRE